MRGALARGSHSMAKHAASSDRSGHQEYILCGQPALAFMEKKFGSSEVCILINAPLAEARAGCEI